MASQSCICWLSRPHSGSKAPTWIDDHKEFGLGIAPNCPTNAKRISIWGYLLNKDPLFVLPQKEKNRPFWAKMNKTPKKVFRKFYGSPSPCEFNSGLSPVAWGQRLGPHSSECGPFFIDTALSVAILPAS